MVGVDQSQLADWLYSPQYCLVSSPGETRAERAVLATLRYSTNPDTLRLLFSDSVTESQVLQVLVVRGERWLVTDLAQSPHQDMAGWLVRLLTVWTDQGDLHYLNILSWTICSLLNINSSRFSNISNISYPV